MQCVHSHCNREPALPRAGRTNTKGDLSIYYLFPGEESSVAQGYAEDGVAPQFLEVAIVENFGVAPRTDTLRLGFSEPVVFSKSDLQHWDEKGYVVIKEAISKEDSKKTVELIFEKVLEIIK